MTETDVGDETIGLKARGREKHQMAQICSDDFLMKVKIRGLLGSLEANPNHRRVTMDSNKRRQSEGELTER